MQELFEGGVDFLQLKQALACRVNSRAGRNQGNTINMTYLRECRSDCVQVKWMSVVEEEATVKE